MIYNEFCGKKLSSLGMGCMRLPTKNEFKEIDVEAVREMVKYAIDNGVNYFDTAWGYHGGKSELVMGEVLSEYPRDQFYLASKFPGYDLSNMDKAEEIFEKQLEKCRVDHFDFYLIHNVYEINIDEYLNPAHGILPYFLEQKKSGRITHLGFSVHGTLETMNRFLEMYGEHMEFAQIQLNWLDWEFQDAKAKVERLRELNIPLWVMEPLRGGSLVKLDEAHENALKALRPSATNPEWAFRFLQSFDDVMVTLSGMSNFDQLKENIDTFNTLEPVSETEFDALIKIAREKTAKTSLPCTSCRYCVTHCPLELDIPRIIELYNEHNYTGGGFIPSSVIRSMDESKRPSACLSCRTCEEVCPQSIKISEMMDDFAGKLKK